MKKYNSLIDHTKLNLDATSKDITNLCKEAMSFGFFSVCINPFFIEQAKKELSNSNVKICTVIGFPLGANTTKSKVYETLDAIKNGADEIDMVINISKLKDFDFDYCLFEINAIKKACQNRVLKVIVETCLLNEKQKKFAVELINLSNADFIKTSTGFSKAGATFEDIILFKKYIKSNKLIKAAGGIRSGSDLIKMVDLGANRIGTSQGVKLIEDINNKNIQIEIVDNTSY